MGTIISMIKSKPDAIPEMVKLNDEDAANIKRTWEIPRATPLDAGEAILLKFFELYPHWQNKFEHFKNTPLLTLKGAPGFRTHAGRIVKLFDDTIQELGNEDFEKALPRIWEVHGRNHYRRSIPIRAFRDLKDVILGILTELCHLTPGEIQSWEKLFCNIYHITFTTMEQMAIETGKSR